MPLDLSPTRSISDRAHASRVRTRVLSVLAGVFLAVAVAASKGVLSKELTGPILTLLLVVLIAAAWSGLRTRRLALDDREKESGRAMIVAIAAQLGRQDDATLERIQSRGGPAGEAAKLILGERRTRANRAAQ